MGTREPLELNLPAGIVKRTGPVQASARYVDGDKVRFLNGKPQKIGGWTRYSAAPLPGLPRGAHSWNDLTSRTVIAVGTTTKLQIVTTDSNRDITPFESTIALTNAFSTTSGLSTVIVHHTAHAKQVGQVVVLSDLSGPIAGLALAGEWIITGVVNSGAYTIDAEAPADSTLTMTGSATVSYEIPPFAENPSQGFGYGVGGYGLGSYGTPRATSSVLLDAGSWTLDNFGQLLLASPYEGKLYQWDPSDANVPRASEVPGAPGAMRGFFVTPERFVMCYGASFDANANIDPMLLRWNSQGDLTVWNAGTTNSANTRRLTVGKKLVGGGAMGAGLSLVWSDTALYTLQFTGSQYVYASNLAGQNCGLAGPNAFAFARGAAFWFGSNSFLTFNGSVTRIQNCDDISEWVLAQIRPFFETKTFAFYNERYNEVWWLFVPTEETEPAFYAAVNLADYSWTTGTLQRTSHTVVNSTPILTGPDGWVYLHETGKDANAAPMLAFIQSGIMQARKGKMLTQVFGFVPDFAVQVGDLDLTITARDRPRAHDLEVETETFGPDADLVDTRMRGRVVDFRLTSNEIGGDFTMGTPALDTMMEAIPR